MNSYAALWFGLALLFFGCAAPGQFQSGNTPSSPEIYGYDPLSALVKFYQGPLDHLSLVRRGTTSMYPSSSDYALEAISKHGPITGWFMTCDRLVRSGRDEMRLSPPIIKNGRRFAHDPVSANDFWFFDDKHSAGE